MIGTKKELLDMIYWCPLRGPVETEMRNFAKKLHYPVNEQLLYVLWLDEDLEPTLEYNKRMRPFLIRLSSQAAWLDLDDDLVKSAVWIEMKHQASLIIDDIQDKSLIRCWRESAIAKYWLEDATLLAYWISNRETPLSKSYFWTKWYKLKDYSSLKGSKIDNMVDWQRLDIHANEWWNTIFDYLKIVDKTVPLLDLALHFGTMPYEYLYTQEKSQAITEFAMELARLYQICDDIDDIKKWKELDPSNIYYYADIAKHPNNLDKIYLKLHDELKKAHDKLLELWVLKENYLMELANVLLPKEEFEIKRLKKR